MSHLPERKEKICLNCKSVIYGRYCHLCGQENIEPKESFWHLITHFVYDITHFDGKFFSTLKYLLFRPGHLPREYLRGRRAAYLNPIRMYVFTSAFFFIIFFSLVAGSPEQRANEAEKELRSTRKSLLEQVQKEKDSLKARKIYSDIADIDSAIAFIRQTGLIPVNTNSIGRMRTGSKGQVIGFSGLANTIREYDSIQNALPPPKRHGWIRRQLSRKSIAINMKYRGNSKEFFSAFVQKFRQSIPQMMFVSLPLVALVLKLLYLRRKHYYYVNHVIFTVHAYIAIYILLLLYYALGGLATGLDLSIFNWMRFFVFLSIFFYVYKCMRNFYQQRRGKTILKFFLLIFTLLFVFILLSAIFIVNSLLNM